MVNTKTKKSLSQVTQVDNIPVLPNKTLQSILTKYGFSLVEDDHTVTLCYGDRIIQNFNASYVTADTLLQWAQRYLQERCQ